MPLVPFFQLIAAPQLGLFIYVFYHWSYIIFSNTTNNIGPYK